MIDYTTADSVFAIGNAKNPSTQEQALMQDVVTAISRQVDIWLSQNFAAQTYTDLVMRYPQIDADGILQCWLPCPVASAPTAIAWKIAASPTWTDISSATVDLFASNSGCQLRIVSPNLIWARTYRVLMKVSFTGGWASLSEVPADFEYACRRLCWMEYKKRDQADQGKTAIPQLGVIVTPGAWPADVRRAFSGYKRVNA